MIEFSKIFCDLHPNELISNYCSHQQCNVALCATCICSHTESHIQRRTAPDYENIRTTYSKMQDSLRSRITALQHQKSRINTIIESIHCKRKGLSELVMQARHQTLDFVNKFYDAKEKQIVRKIDADEKKLGLHNQNRMETLINLISRDVNSLFAAASDLNSQNFLQNFNRIRTQVLSNSVITQKQVSDELDKNENYDVNITINPIYINDIKNGLEKSIQMVYDEKRWKVADRVESTNKSSRVTIGNSNEQSGVNVVKRVSQSLPKNISNVNHPSRCTSTLVDQIPYFIKQTPPPQMKQQSHQNHHQSFNFNPTYMSNTSMPVQMTNTSMQMRPSQHSRPDLRASSSEKNIKQNSQKNPLAQSYMGQSMSHNHNHLSTPQLETGKKIRRSGLTVLRTVDNEKN